MSHDRDEDMAHCELVLNVSFHAEDKGEGSRFMDDVAAQMLDLFLARVDAHPALERCPDTWDSGESLIANLVVRREKEAIEEAAANAGRAAYRQALEELTEAGGPTITQDDIDQLLKGDE